MVARQTYLAAAIYAILAFGQESTSVDDTSADISYQTVNGSWAKLADLDPTLGLWNNTQTYSSFKGNSISWTFQGSDIEYWGGTGPNRGQCLIQLDGEPQGEFNGFAATDGPPRQLFKKSSLDASNNHTITITVASDTAPNICDLDRFVYTPGPAATTSDDNKPTKRPTNSNTRQTTTSGQPATTISASSSSSGTNSAAIGGGIAGGIALLGLLAGALWLNRRRRRRRRQQQTDVEKQSLLDTQPHKSPSRRGSKLGRKLATLALKHIAKPLLEALFESAGIPSPELVLQLPSINDLVPTPPSASDLKDSIPDGPNVSRPSSLSVNPAQQAPLSTPNQVLPSAPPATELPRIFTPVSPQDVSPDSISLEPATEPPNMSTPVSPQDVSPDSISSEPATEPPSTSTPVLPPAVSPDSISSEPATEPPSTSTPVLPPAVSPDSISSEPATEPPNMSTPVSPQDVSPDSMSPEPATEPPSTSTPESPQDVPADGTSSEPATEPPSTPIPELPQAGSPDEQSPQLVIKPPSISGSMLDEAHLPEDKPTVDTPAQENIVFDPKKLLIITCMDARLDARKAFKLTEKPACGVVRNSGGRARDSLSEVLLAQHLNTEHLRGPLEIAVVHHTRCDTIPRMAIEDIKLAVREDMKFLSEHPDLMKENLVTGWILDARDKVTRVM
ncbi:hypothetical protein BKA62DRAFT_101334 [Auriculariales sp. MPI-PUGE-AT-0066]|nr:hypothetical protein BKA62DRAFT_101334 [Auriculariales sp. MPI-PUGE-AT-0066]